MLRYKADSHSLKGISFVPSTIKAKGGFRIKGYWQYSTSLCTIESRNINHQPLSVCYLSRIIPLKSTIKLCGNVYIRGGRRHHCHHAWRTFCRRGREKRDTPMIILYPVCFWFIVTAENSPQDYVVRCSGSRCVGGFAAFQSRSLWESLRRRCWEHSKPSLLNIQPRIC